MTYPSIGLIGTYENTNEIAAVLAGRYGFRPQESIQSYKPENQPIVISPVNDARMVGELLDAGYTLVWVRVGRAWNTKPPWPFHFSMSITPNVTIATETLLHTMAETVLSGR